MSLFQKGKRIDIASALIDKGHLSSGDANDLKSGAEYVIGGGVKNLPQSDPLGILLVFAPHAGLEYIKQEFTSAFDSSTYVRIYDTASGWKSWIQLGGGK